MSNCDICANLVQKSEQLVCSTCNKVYHHLCQQMNASKFKRLSKIARSTWECTNCINKKDQDTATSADMNTDCDSDDVDENDGDIRKIIREEIKNTMRSEVKILVCELRNEMDVIRKQLEELKLSGTFDISQQNELKSDLQKLQNENSELRSQNAEMRDTITQLRIQVNYIDQNLRDANLEIHGLPENKNEILPNVLTQLSKVVSYELKDCDIMKCTRVASINNNKTRPRTVVVRLRSPRCRDEFYSAITRYNKSNKDAKLNTSLLGYGGDKEPIYISEHLSPAYKSLHAAARLKAKEKAYKFVWVRYGKIFVAKDENSGSILIKDKQCLDKIV